MQRAVWRAQPSSARPHPDLTLHPAAHTPQDTLTGAFRASGIDVNSVGSTTTSVVKTAATTAVPAISSFAAFLASKVRRRPSRPLFCPAASRPCPPVHRIRRQHGQPAACHTVGCDEQQQQHRRVSRALRYAPARCAVAAALAGVPTPQVCPRPLRCRTRSPWLSTVWEQLPCMCWVPLSWVAWRAACAATLAS